MQKIKITILTLLMVLVVVVQVAAETPEKICLEKNHSTYLDLWGLDSVAIANPEIADVTVVSSREILIIAKKQGSTSLQVKFQSGNRKSYAIVVTDGDRAVAQTIEIMINCPNVTVQKAGENIVLEGFVEDQLEKKRAETIAGMYATKVINLLEMENPKQVKIEAKIVEISSDKLDKIGLQYFNASEIDKETGAVSQGTTGSFGMGQSFGKDGPYGWFGSYADINANLLLLIVNGDAKVLSQPNIVTMSGEKANILIGGEIPIPISNSDGQLTVEWREYGIKLNIEPNVGVDEQITGKINAEISSLDMTSAAAVNIKDGLSIPALRSRKAETVVTVQSGNTMAIGGLISSEESSQITKVPLLGDLPIIGQFFRSTSKNKDRKEIIILITPTLLNEEYRTPLSHKMKNFIRDKAEEEKRLAEDPEELKKEKLAEDERLKVAEQKAKEDAKKAKIKAEAEKAKAKDEKSKPEQKPIKNATDEKKENNKA